MKIVSYEKCEMDIIECDCGFHLGVDTSFCLQGNDFTFICPSCGTLIDTADIDQMEYEDWNEKQKEK